MNVSALAERRPVLSWLTFYVAVAASWMALVWLAAGPAHAPADAAWPLHAWPLRSASEFLLRCLESPETLGLGHLTFMWALMSLAMMLPTALPALLRFATLVRGRGNGGADNRFTAFLAAYMTVWLGFSALAAFGQLTLTRLHWLGTDGRVTDAMSAALLLGFAGFYQFSRLKHACLSRCRHPMTFFMAHWRDGLRGAFAMGLRHGLDCLGCCWALMLLAFIGGTMNLAWMGLAMVLMILEKLAGPGRYVTIPLGLVLILAAGFFLGNALQSI